jgi:hypothetical protein
LQHQPIEPAIDPFTRRVAFTSGESLILLEDLSEFGARLNPGLTHQIG